MISWHQHLRSYWHPVILEKTSSPFNPVLEVILQEGRVLLHAAHVNYSFGGLHLAFADTFQEYGVYQRNIQQVLILGLGAGSVPYLLNSRIKNLRMTGVEIDPEILRIGNKYFKLQDYTNLQAINADAEIYLQQTSDSWDLIIVDIFVDWKVPDFANHYDFLIRLKQSLSPMGLLIFNRMIFQDKTQLVNTTFENTFSTIFPKYQKYHTLCNDMLLFENRL